MLTNELYVYTPFVLFPFNCVVETQSMIVKHAIHYRNRIVIPCVFESELSTYVDFFLSLLPLGLLDMRKMCDLSYAMKF